MTFLKKTNSTKWLKIKFFSYKAKIRRKFPFAFLQDWNYPTPGNADLKCDILLGWSGKAEHCSLILKQQFDIIEYLLFGYSIFVKT